MSKQKKNNLGGRPTKFKAEYIDMATSMCRLGATLPELAVHFKVALSTVNKWAAENKEFSDAITRGRVEADAQVRQSLFGRANGYKQEEIRTEAVLNPLTGQREITKQVKTVKSIPPDVHAQQFWLKNRQPDQWRDRQVVDQNISGGGRTEIVVREYDPAIDGAPPEGYSGDSEEKPADVD